MTALVSLECFVIYVLRLSQGVCIHSFNDVVVLIKSSSIFVVTSVVVTLCVPSAMM